MTTPEAMSLLEEAATLQREFDRNAATWQRTHFRLRISVLVVSILAALFGVLGRAVFAGESLGGVLPTLVIGLPILMVVLLAVNYVINPGQRWVAYRYGSEVLKSRTFAFATGADQVDGSTPAQRETNFRQGLIDIRDQVEQQQPKGLLTRMGESWRRLWNPTPAGLGPANAPDMPQQSLDAEAYIQQRMLPQRDWYDRRGREHRRTLGWLSFGIMLFSGVAGLLVWLQLPEWIPVATTIVGALATYAGLSNAEFLANSYRATVNQLDGLYQSWRNNEFAQMRNGYREFVSRVEQVISREYTGWNLIQPSDQKE